MKKNFIIFMCVVAALLGCSTVQFLLKSTFPYSSTLIIPASSKTNPIISVTSTASSFDQIFGHQNGTDYNKEVRVASARLNASNPTNQNLGLFKSIKLYLINNGNGAEVTIASRSDVSENIGNNLVLEIDNSRFLDNYVRC